MRRTRRIAGRIAAAALGVALCGCAVNPAPRGWLPPPEALPTHTRGAWVVLSLDRRPAEEGELIAVDEVRVHVLTRTGLRSLPVGAVRRARLVIYESPAARKGGWAAIVLSHGWWMVLTFPLWIAALAEVSRDGIISVEGRDLPALRGYARFPQGLPDGTAAADLGPL
jgi:hypothetical protein